MKPAERCGSRETDEKKRVIYYRDGWEKLAFAIVLQAAKDYRDALKWLKQWPQSRELLRKKRSCETFFHSWWFGVLTDANPDYILRVLREEAA